MKKILQSLFGSSEPATPPAEVQTKEDANAKILLAARYHKLKKEQLAGNIDDEQYLMELERITHALFAKLGIAVSQNVEPAPVRRKPQPGNGPTSNVDEASLNQIKADLEERFAEALQQDPIPVSRLLSRNRLTRLSLEADKGTIAKTFFQEQLKQMKAALAESITQDPLGVVPADTAHYFVGDIKERIDRLSALVGAGALADDLKNCEAQYNKMKKEQTMGLISSLDYNRAMAKLDFALANVALEYFGSRG